jgi:PAS domain S-box-containing protein
MASMKFFAGPAWANSPNLTDTRHARMFRMWSHVLGWVCFVIAVAGLLDLVAARLWTLSHDRICYTVMHQPLAVFLAVLMTSLGVISVPRFPLATRWIQAGLGALVLGMGLVTTGTGNNLWHLEGLAGWIVLLLGCALGAGGSRVAIIGYIRQFALFVLFFLAALILIGHLYEASSENGDLLQYLRIPWVSALTVLIAGHALLFQHPNFGVMRLLSGDGFGCHIMRRLLPSVILLLVFLGWLLAFGESHGWYPPSFGEGLYAVLASTGFSGILLFAAASLNRLDDERHERERDLRRSQAQLQAVMDHTPAIVCMKDLHGKYLLVNRSFCRSAAKSPEECLGRHFTEILPGDVAESVREHDAKALRTREPVEYVETMMCGDGIARAHLCACFPLLDAGGDPYAICGVYTDINEIKLQENEITRLNASLHEKTLRQEAANSELEAFSYSVSHDLRAPLRHIAGFGQLLAQRNRDKLDDKSRHYLDVIQASVGRMGLLIDDLLSFSRASKVELSPKRIHTPDLVAEVRVEIESHRTGPAIIWEVGPLPDMLGDPAMMRLVWVNLLSNAAKYSAKSPQPRITVAFGPDEDGVGAFSVRDNGAGFDMRYIDKLFGVFQRLHSNQEYEGTGIGLAMVRRILERHGGRIRAEGIPGEGACFYFMVPGTGVPPAATPADGSKGDA